MDVSIAAQVSSPLLTSLTVDLDTVEYIPTKNLTAGVRVFHAGKILDVSLDAIETKLLSSF